jgi:hypothetical protein
VRRGLPGGGSPIVNPAEVRIGTGGALNEGCSGRWLVLGVDSQGTIARPSICSCQNGRGRNLGPTGMRGEEQDEGDVGGETEGRRGLHGEPLRGRPRGRGMKHVLCWLGGVGYQGWSAGSLQPEQSDTEPAGSRELRRRLPRGEPSKARAGTNEKQTELSHGMSVKGREVVL